MSDQNYKKTQVELGEYPYRIKASGPFLDKDVQDFVPSPESTYLLIDTPCYDGPLDLLLHLIKKHSIDIFDIPIHLITQKYLEALEKMKNLNLDVAGEFLFMAASLALIKSQMLLPKEEKVLEAEKEEEDPRKDLVQKLLKYKAFKEAAEFLENRPKLGEAWFFRGQKEEFDDYVNEDKEVVLAPIEIFNLIEVFSNSIKKASKHTVHIVSKEKISISARISDLIDFCYLKNKFTLFDAVKFFPFSEKIDIIITFLSLLEMAKLRLIKIYHNDNNELCLMINKENFYDESQNALKNLKEEDFS